LRSSLRIKAQVRTEAGPRAARVRMVCTVWPVSTMSSTMITCLSVMSVRRSMTRRTTPLDTVPEP
jgi:hypothetical protein